MLLPSALESRVILFTNGNLASLNVATKINEQVNDVVSVSVPNITTNKHGDQSEPLPSV